MEQTGFNIFNISELVDEIRDQARSAWRYRRQAIILAWVLCLGAWLAVLSMPDEYRASSRLYIDTEDSLRPLLQGMALPTDLLGEVEIMLKSILSRPALEKIAERSGFDLGNPDPKTIDDLISRLRKAIKVNLNRKQILEISMIHSDPTVAYAGVDVVIGMLSEGLLGSSRDDTRSARDFLEKKLRDYEILLTEAESSIADFKRDNVGQLSGSGEAYYPRLQAAMVELSSLNLAIQLARQRLRSLENQMSGEEPVFGIMPPSQQGSVLTSPQIDTLEAQLTELRLAYTDSHPDVIRTKKLIEELRADLGDQPLVTAYNDANSIDRNPVYQQLKIQFNETEVELSQLMTQRAAQAAAVESLKNRMDTIPEIEAELKRLTRSYDVYKSQHDELLQRLEKARLTQEVGSSSSGLSFKVLEPAKVSSKPVGPDRKLLITAGLLFSLAVGMGLAFLRGITTPVFFSTKKLEKAFDIPVIGSIVAVKSPEQLALAKRDAGVVVSAFVCLIGCYGVLIVFNQVSVHYLSRVLALMGITA